MKKSLFFFGVLVFGWILWPVAAYAEILTVFSDQGVPGMPQNYNPIITFAGGPAIFVGTSSAVVPPEGLTSFQTIDETGLWAGWGVVYPSAQNLTRFNTGEYRFWVYSSTGDVEVQFKNGNNLLVMDTSLSLLGWNWSTMHDQWVLMRIGLSVPGLDLSSVQYPGLFTANHGPATFYIDNVHFINSTTDPNFNVSIKNRSDNGPASQVLWNNVVLPTGWGLADQYVSLEVDVTTMTWGVQVYTNNTDPNANPRYTGKISSFTATPAGLVDTADTTTKKSIAWAMRADISTLTVVAADPNSGTPDSFQWLFAEDAAQVAVPDLNAAAFANADPYITVRNNVGIHFSQSPNDFGPADPPYRVYLEADFSNALTPKTYQTSELIIELFYL